MKEEKIKVLALLPMELPKEIELNNTLEAMQNFVGGLIECITLRDTGSEVTLVCNDEGKLLGLPLNRPLCTFYSNAASTRIFNHTKAIFAPCAHFGLVRSTCRGQTHQHTTTIRTFYRNHCHEKLPPKIIQLSPSDSA